MANRETEEDTDLLFMWSELSGLAPNQFPLVMANSDLKMFNCLSGIYKSLLYLDLGVGIICFHFAMADCQREDYYQKISLKKDLNIW